MAPLGKFLVALICFISTVYSDDHGENVVSLTTSSFPKGNAETPNLVMFFAPWCGHCKRLAPVFDELAKKYNVQEKRESITIAKVDCTVETALCKEHGVSGYPTLKYFDKSMQETKYDKPRTKESFEEFIADKLGRATPADADKPIVKHPKQIQMVTAGLAELTAENWPTAMGTNHRYFVMFYAPWCGHCKQLKPVWTELARQYAEKKVEDFMMARIDCTVNQKICSQFDVKGYPTLMWFAGGRMLEKYQGAREETDLQDFISQMTAVEDPYKYSSDGRIPEDIAPTTEADPAATRGSVDDGLHTLVEATFDNAIKTGHTFVKFYAPWCGHCKSLAPVWAKLAKDHKDDKDFKIAKIDCTAHQAVCSRYSVKGYPTLLYFHNGEQTDNYSGARDEVALAAYITAQVNLLDNLPPTDGKAEEKAVGGVFELTSANFAASVAEETTFVMFYAPWCGHCKKLKPTWEELGTFFQGYTDIKIAKMDCTSNQDICQNYEVKGYPTLMFFVEGAKVDKHGGGRDLESLKSSVEKTLAGAVKDRLKKEAAGETADAAAVSEGPGEVVVLNKDNFDEVINKDYTFVKFYAPWCGHCKKLAPTWIDLAAEVKSNAAVTIAELDCTVADDKPFCGKFEVKGFPSLLFFKNGEKVEKYSGGRDLNALKSYVEKQAPNTGAKTGGAAPTEAPATEGNVMVLTADNFADVTKSGFTFVKFYAPWCGHCKKLIPTWTELAGKADKVRIAKLDCTEHRDVCTDNGVNGFPTLIMFNNGASVGEHNGGRDLAGLEAFIKSKTRDEL